MLRPRGQIIRPRPHSIWPRPRPRGIWSRPRRSGLEHDINNNIYNLVIDVHLLEKLAIMTVNIGYAALERHVAP